jgi:hypothetical protein
MRSTPITGDNDGNSLRKDRWIVGNMLIIAQQQLKGVVSDWKGNLGLRLSRPEMQVIEIVGYPLVQGRQRGVNQKVMVTRIGFSIPAGATPMLRRPKRTVSVRDRSHDSLRRTIPPSCRLLTLELHGFRWIEATREQIPDNSILLSSIGLKRGKI